MLAVTEARLPEPAAAPYHRWGGEGDDAWLLFYRTPSGYRLRFRGQADFEVASDGHVTCAPHDGVAQAAWTRLFTSYVLPLVRGQTELVLHASSASFGAKAVLFVGASGQGKSTLAATLCAAGAHLVADDVSLLSPDRGGGFRVHPAPPVVRLWDDSAREVAAKAQRRLPTPPNLKPSYQLTEAADGPRSLAAIYLLGADAPSIAMQEVAKVEAFVQLSAQSFILDPFRKEDMARRLAKLQALCDEVPVYRLSYPRRYDQCAMVADRLQQHLEGLSCRSIRHT